MMLAALASKVGTVRATPGRVKVGQLRAAGPEDWRLIGATEANYSADHGTIALKGPFGNVRRIKFTVTGAPLTIDHMVVSYDGGAPERIDVRRNIVQGDGGRVIGLRDVGNRSIRKIEFWYDTSPFLRGRANVTVVGMK
jgi:hypothetical protein